MNTQVSRFVATSPSPPFVPWRRVIALILIMIASAIASEWMRPTDRLAEHKAPIRLESQIPESFGEWRLDPAVAPVVPDPGLQAMLNSLYSQTLARTYVNRNGERVMLSVAYGSDQGNEATAVHRPEFCYSSVGFRVNRIGSDQLKIGVVEVPVARLVASLGARIEPITYWVTLDETATLPGFGRKLQQIRYGLSGKIPDGMLVRVSSISSSPQESFALQQRFLDQLYGAIPEEVKTRYFGSSRSS